MSNNNETNGLAIVIGLFAAMVFILGAFLFAIILFLSFLMTLWCFYAWNQPRTLFGETTTPEEARAFVYRGLAGAILAPFFIAFVSAIFGVQIRPDYLHYFPLGGYAFGSLVIGYYIEKAKIEAAEKEAAMPALPPPAQPVRTVRTIEAAPSAPPTDQPQRPPFRFASWDDEEALRK